jgi:hypothetical protein
MPVVRSMQESLGATLSNLRWGIQIRMVAGFAEVIEREETLVAAVRSDALRVMRTYRDTRPLILCDLASFPDSGVLSQIFLRGQTFYERFLKS